MGKRFDLLVFDWDGTVVDSAGHIATSLQAASADLELPVPSDQQARHIIGLGLIDALTYLFPELPSARYPDLADRYRHHYLAGDHNVHLFAGAYESLQSFRAGGFQLAVATGKARRGLDRALQSTNMTSIFHASRCADEGLPKPHPDMLLYLIEAMGVDRTRTLMIGDTTHDLLMARNAGVEAVAVAYGAHPRELLVEKSPLACISSFAELAQWVEAFA
jgi:phosphoglycolate phosphatase